MTGSLSRRQADERRETLAQILVLDTTRALIRSGASHADAVAARVLAAEELLRQADRDAAHAIEEGESYAEVARLLNITRQSARERYSHLKAV